MKGGLECNFEDTFEKFMDLTADEMKKTVRRALRAGAKELQSQTKSNMQSVIMTHDNPHWYRGTRINYNDDITDAVRIGRIEDVFGEELTQKVHIMGTRADGSGTYRARFLEKGTKQREARKKWKDGENIGEYKKARNLGQITPRWFFKSAQQSVLPRLESIFIREIDKTVQKLNNEKI